MSCSIRNLVDGGNQPVRKCPSNWESLTKSESKSLDKNLSESSKNLLYIDLLWVQLQQTEDSKKKKHSY